MNDLIEKLKEENAVFKEPDMITMLQATYKTPFALAAALAAAEPWGRLIADPKPSSDKVFCVLLTSYMRMPNTTSSTLDLSAVEPLQNEYVYAYDIHKRGFVQLHSYGLVKVAGTDNIVMTSKSNVLAEFYVDTLLDTLYEFEDRTPNPHNAWEKAQKATAFHRAVEQFECQRLLDADPDWLMEIKCRPFHS